MSRRRRLGLIALLGRAAAFAAAPAEARPPAGPPTVYPETLTTEHLQIHYTGDVVPAPVVPNADRITHQQAGDLAANAERAYDLFVTQWGFTPPKNDGDGRLDICVRKPPTDVLGAAYRETATPSTAWISIAPGETQKPQIVAHELMHAIHAAFTCNGSAGISGSDAAPGMSLDCDSEACGEDTYDIGGYLALPNPSYASGAR